MRRLEGDSWVGFLSIWHKRCVLWAIHDTQHIKERYEDEAVVLRANVGYDYA